MKTLPILILLLALFASASVQALILTGEGNSPVSDPGWPAGALAVANLTNRVGWSEGPPFGGGQWTFYFRGAADTLRQALDAFVAIKADHLDVVLHDGVGSSPFLKGDTTCDWSFEVWVPANWEPLYNNPQSFFGADQPNFRQPVAAPRLDLWLSPGRLDWKRVELPAHVMVRDERATSRGFRVGSGSVVIATVTDSADARPVPGARLAVTATGGNESKARKVGDAAADASGRIQWTGLGEGTYCVVVEAEGYVARVVEYVHLGTNDYREYHVTLARPATLRGWVRDASGKPLSGVRVTARNILGSDGKGYPLPAAPETMSDSAGHFQLEGLPVGALQVNAYRQGYHHRWNPAELVQVPQAGAGDASEYVVHMEATGRVSIQVVGADGRPVQHLGLGEVQARIEAEGGAVVGSWGGSANVDTNGVWVFEDVPPGRYRVSGRPFCPGEAPVGVGVVTVTVEEGRSALVDLVRP